MNKKTVVKRQDAIKHTFKSVSLDSLAVGEKSLVTKMNYVAGNYADEHMHLNEQSGYVISGKYLLTVADRNFELLPADSYAIPGDILHSFKVFEGVMS